jgi:PAS domain-containing protein
MRSARSLFIFNEAVTFLVILILAFFLVFLFQSHFKNTYIKSQKNNIDKVDLLIDNFLKERRSEFTTITLRGQVDKRDYLLNSFSDVYVLDRNLVITRIIKKAGNSNIFKGYDLSKSRAGEFFKTVNSSSGRFSSMFRSPENDTLSLYVAVKEGPVIIAGRISLDSLTGELGRIVEFDGSILIFINEDGFVISSSNDTVPPHVDIKEERAEISLDKNYLVSSRKSEYLGSRIALLTPMSEVYQILNSTKLYYPVLIAAVIIIMIFKLSAQLFLFIRPLEQFTSLLGSWNLEQSEVHRTGFISGIKEINILYKTFYDKALQLKKSVLEIMDKEYEMGRMRRYLKSIIDSMPSVLIAIDRNLIVNEWNAAAEKLTGIPSGESYNKCLLDVLPEMKRIEPAVKEASGSGKLIEFKREKFDFSGDRLYNILIFPVDAERGMNIGIRLDDVTELFRAEQNLVQSQKMEVIGTLAGGLAHDFNNILAAIMGSVSILQLRLKSSSDLNHERDYFVKYLSMLEDSSLKASGVISRLLTLSRKQDYDMKPVDLNQIISSVENICVNSFSTRTGASEFMR